LHRLQLLLRGLQLLAQRPDLTLELLCDLVGESVTRASMLTLREDIADLTERLSESEATAAALPHRSKYLLLVIDFLRDYLELHRELVDRVERELAEDDQRAAS